MSVTACPGDTFYPYVANELSSAVTGMRAAVPTSSTTTSSTSTTITTSTTTTVAGTTTAAPTTAAAVIVPMGTSDNGPSTTEDTEPGVGDGPELAMGDEASANTSAVSGSPSSVSFGEKVNLQAGTEPGKGRVLAFAGAGAALVGVALVGRGFLRRQKPSVGPRATPQHSSVPRGGGGDGAVTGFEHGERTSDD